MIVFRSFNTWPSFLMKSAAHKFVFLYFPASLRRELFFVPLWAVPWPPAVFVRFLGRDVPVCIARS